MTRYRLTHAAQTDILSILAWSDEQFGEEGRKRYEALIFTAMRDATSRTDNAGQTPRPELGEGVFSWHLLQSRAHSRGGRVRGPRHFLICWRDHNTLVIGRILHDAMDLKQPVDSQPWWE